jgi:low temperature requirement protein LtrA
MPVVALLRPGRACRWSGIGPAAHEGRNRLATNAYSLALFPLIAGVIYVALGIEQVVAHLSHDQPDRTTDPLPGWTPTIALYGGTVLYLTGRMLFLRIATASIPPSHFAATGVTLALLPAARYLPALAGLGLLTAVLVAFVGLERFTRAGQAPAISWMRS